MSSAQLVSIDLPAELITKAQQAADLEQRPLNEVVGDAIRRYVEQPSLLTDTVWREIFEYGHARGRELGITCEEDVERILGEFRTEDRK